jgi:hypothetical protein
MRASLALFLFAAGLALAAPAVAQTGFWTHLFGPVADSRPPWAVEAPGGAGSRYGLGLDVFFEHQESLKITFNEQRVVSGDLSEIARTDPGLLNRKFDLRWNLTGTGVQPAIVLPLPRTLGIYPTLVVQAAVADVGLDFRDRNRPGDSSSLDGRGPLFGAGLDLTRSLCRSCPWFAGASYFFQKIPRLSVDRSPAFLPEGFEVLEDRVRLDRDVHAVSTRIGYGFSGSRAVSYLGVLHRWNDVKIDDRLRYRDQFQTETSLASRTRLESEVTLAVAGVEARLGPRLFGRLEASVGGRDRGGVFRVVYLPGRPPSEQPEQPSREETARIAARLREIRTELSGVVDNLGDVVALETLLALLDRFEKEVLGVLPYPKYAALRDLVTVRFQQARDLLKQGNAELTSPRAVPAVFSPRSDLRIELAALTLADSANSKALQAFTTVVDLVDRIWKVFNEDDIVINPCVRTEPDLDAEVQVYPLSYRKGGGKVWSNDNLPLFRGLYAYTVTKAGYGTIMCPAGSDEGCKLDLLTLARPLIRCRLSLSKDDPNASCGVTKEPSGSWECKSR